METEDNKELSNSKMITDFQAPKTPRDWRSNTPSSSFKRIIDCSELAYANPQRQKKPKYLKSRSRLTKFSYEHPSAYKHEAELKVPDSDLSVLRHQKTTFEKREITTIQEEVFYYKGKCKPVTIIPPRDELCRFAKQRRSRFKKNRKKVASLKAVIGRLKEMCLSKPEVLQNKLPEEIVKLFSGIQI